MPICLYNIFNHVFLGIPIVCANIEYTLNLFIHLLKYLRHTYSLGKSKRTNKVYTFISSKSNFLKVIF